MKRTIGAIAAGLLATGALVLIPTSAHAVTASGTDPTGDVTAGTSYDVTSVNVTLTSSTVVVALGFAGAVPALTDPTWATESDEGRAITISLGDALGSGYYLDGDGLITVDRNGNELTISKCTAPAVTGYTTSTLTFTADATCFDYPGQVKVEAAVQSKDEPAAGEIDAVIAPAVTAFPFDSATTAMTPVTATLPGGYYQLGADGGVFSFGDAAFFGSTGSMKLNKPVVGMSSLAGNTGYRFAASDGGVFAYGAAQFYGSMGGSHLNKPVVGMATTSTGNGYWLVASDGGIFAYGDAGFYGSAGAIHLNKPIVGMTPTSTGHGYWLVASDGGIFAYGDAAFYGSTGAMTLNKPIVGMARTSTNHGYALAASDGGIFAYGDAGFFGSGLNDFDDNVVGIAVNSTNNGYYLAGSDGSVYNYGTVSDYGDIQRLLAASDKEPNAATVDLDVLP